MSQPHKTVTTNYVTTNEELNGMIKEMNAFDSMTIGMPPLRKLRADRITAEIMSILDKHFRDNRDALENNTMRHIHRELIDMFFKADVDIITEIDRMEAGLPRRNAYGFTKEEMRIWEVKKLERMLQPMPSIVVPEYGTKTQCPKCGEKHNV